jgi:RNA-directed DNA polymerase
MIKFIEHRIGDKRIVRLIQKWLSAGAMENGLRVATEEGTPQGAVISPLLANIYLHYVYDLWINAWRKRHAAGDMIVVRYADDTVVGFQFEGDARNFLRDLKERLAQFGLELHADKTRLLAFGRFVAKNRALRGLGRPETFDFLGFTHICGVTRDGGHFQLQRKTKRKRKWATIQRVGLELQRIRHSPIDEQGRWLATVLKGHYAYFAVPTNMDALRALWHHVKVRWYLSLRRRSQRRRLTWPRMNAIAAKYLPLPSIVHPWPDRRFLVKHPR